MFFHTEEKDVPLSDLSDCLTGSEFTPPATGRKEFPSSSRTQYGPSVMPTIPKWGTPASHKRKETEPVVFFQVPRAVTSTEITFNPPMSVPPEYQLPDLLADV
jgi:hypothetical protein